MRKVILVSYHFPPYGGKAVQRASKLAKYLPHYGWEPIIFSMPLGEPGVPQDKTLLDELPGDIRIYRPSNFNPWKLVPYDLRKCIYNPLPDRYIQWALASEKKLAGIIAETGAEAMITTSPTHSTQMLGLFVKRRTGIPWIADFRDQWTGHPDFGRKKNADKIIEMETEVLINADAVTGVTPRILRDFSGRAPDSKLHLIENGYDEEDFKGMDLNYRSGDKALKIAYGGTLSDIHDPGSFLKAIESLLKEEKIDIGEIKVYFTINEESRKRLYQFSYLIEKEMLIINNYMPHRENLIHLNRMDALLSLVTKGRDIYSGKTFEYIFLGLPIISISAPGDDLDRLLRETDSGFAIDWNDEKGIKKAIMDLIECKRKGKITRKSGFSPEIERFSRKNLACKFAGIIEGICRSPH